MTTLTPSPTKANPAPFLDIENFFHHYWKRKPLFLPQAFPKFTSPLSEDELAGLACEKIIESRIVLEHSTTPWQLRHGPFKAKDFQKLPNTHWTLLVQAVNHWIPQVSDILNHFNWLPMHYIDDIMISYAAEQGSVGAHFDYYDVFILQGSGKRHWRLGEFCSPQTATRKETPLGILQEFNTLEEYVLEPGDMLYIPQQQAHWCVALEPGLSYSIGFRTPSTAELLSSFCSERLAQLNETQRLQPSALHTLTPAALNSQTLDQVKQLLQNLIQDPEHLRDWFGRFITEPKYPELEQEPTPQNKLTLDQQLVKYTLLRHNESSRFAYYEEGNQVYLYVDGKSYQYPASLRELTVLLCNHRQLDCHLVISSLKSAADKQLLQMLLDQGLVYLS